MASDDDRRPPPIVLYDANLLYPFHLRNLLVQLGVHYIIASRWTDATHENGSAAWQQPASRPAPDCSARMKRVLPEADVQGYVHRIASLSLPDPADGHMLAAAIEAGAEITPTFRRPNRPSIDQDQCSQATVGP